MAPRVIPKNPRPKPRPLTYLEHLKEEAQEEKPEEGTRVVIRSFKRGICAQFARRCNKISTRLIEYKRKNGVSTPFTAREARRGWIIALETWEQIEIMGNCIARTFKAQHKVTHSLVEPWTKFEKTKNVISRSVRKYAQTQESWDPSLPGQHQALLAVVSVRGPDMTEPPPPPPHHRKIREDVQSKEHDKVRYLS